MIVALSLLRHGVGHDAPEQTAGGVAFHHIGIHSIYELMLGQALCAIIRLAILVGSLTPHGVGDTCTCHEVTLIAAVDKHTGTHGALRRDFGIGGIFHHDRLYVVALFLSTDNTPLVPYILVSLQSSLVKEPLEGSQRHLWLEIKLWRGHTIMIADAAIELACITANDALMRGAVANVGPPQSACGHTANTFGGRDKQHLLALKLGGICCHDTGRCAAIYADIHICRLRAVCCICWHCHHSGQQ